MYISYLLHKILQEAKSVSIKLLEAQKYCGRLFIDMAWIQNHAENKYSYHHYCLALLFSGGHNNLTMTNLAQAFH